MRLMFALVMMLAALGIARADDRPEPVTDRAAPAVKLNPSIGWRLDAVVRMDEDRGVPVLVIEGDVINSSDKERAAPQVRFGVLDEAGREIYHWTVAPTQPRVRPRDWVAFEAKLESPPLDMVGLEIQTVETE